MQRSYANLWLRTLAFLLDYLVIFIYFIILVAVSVLLGFGPLRRIFQVLFANPNASELSAFLILVLPVILYFALLESSSWQASWGKRRMGLRVTDAHGGRLSLTRATARSIIKFVPWELTHVCLWRIPGWPFAPQTPPLIITVGLVLVWVLVGAYIISLLASRTHQALYDRLAGSYVIVAPEPSGSLAH